MAQGDSLTMVLVTRKDLKLSKGKLSAQCSHAAVECALKANRESPKTLQSLSLIHISEPTRPY